MISAILPINKSFIPDKINVKGNNNNNIIEIVFDGNKMNIDTDKDLNWDIIINALNELHGRKTHVETTSFEIFNQIINRADSSKDQVPLAIIDYKLKIFEEITKYVSNCSESVCGFITNEEKITKLVNTIITLGVKNKTIQSCHGLLRDKKSRNGDVIDPRFTEEHILCFDSGGDVSKYFDNHKKCHYCHSFAKYLDLSAKISPEIIFPKKEISIDSRVFKLLGYPDGSSLKAEPCYPLPSELKKMKFSYEIIFGLYKNAKRKLEKKCNQNSPDDIKKDKLFCGNKIKSDFVAKMNVSSPKTETINTLSAMAIAKSWGDKLQCFFMFLFHKINHSEKKFTSKKKLIPIGMTTCDKVVFLFCVLLGLPCFYLKTETINSGLKEVKRIYNIFYFNPENKDIPDETPEEKEKRILTETKLNNINSLKQLLRNHKSHYTALMNELKTQKYYEKIVSQNPEINITDSFRENFIKDIDAYIKKIDFLKNDEDGKQKKSYVEQQIMECKNIERVIEVSENLRTEIKNMKCKWFYNKPPINENIEQKTFKILPDIYRLNNQKPKYDVNNNLINELFYMSYKNLFEGIGLTVNSFYSFNLIANLYHKQKPKPKTSIGGSSMSQEPDTTNFYLNTLKETFIKYADSCSSIMEYIDPDDNVIEYCHNQLQTDNDDGKMIVNDEPNISTDEGIIDIIKESESKTEETRSKEPESKTGMSISKEPESKTGESDPPDLVLNAIEDPESLDKKPYMIEIKMTGEEVMFDANQRIFQDICFFYKEIMNQLFDDGFIIIPIDFASEFIHLYNELLYSFDVEMGMNYHPKLLEFTIMKICFEKVIMQTGTEELIYFMQNYEIPKRYLEEYLYDYFDKLKARYVEDLKATLIDHRSFMETSIYLRKQELLNNLKEQSNFLKKISKQNISKFQGFKGVENPNRDPGKNISVRKHIKHMMMIGGRMLAKKTRRLNKHISSGKVRKTFRRPRVRRTRRSPH
jgi:hypothetical protein